VSDFSDLLRQHRSELGWRQADLAEQIGTNQTQVSQWETGREAFGLWAVSTFFDKLLQLFGYPQDLLDWWAEREVTQIEETVAQARSYLDEAATRHGKKAPVLKKLDRLIEQSRVHLAELTALRNEMQSLFSDTEGSAAP
jgi:transcriptional regulator with XRE-family HTH domain